MPISPSLGLQSWGMQDTEGLARNLTGPVCAGLSEWWNEDL